MNKMIIIGIVIVCLLLSSSMGGGYYYYYSNTSNTTVTTSNVTPSQVSSSTPPASSGSSAPPASSGSSSTPPASSGSSEQILMNNFLIRPITDDGSGRTHYIQVDASNPISMWGVTIPDFNRVFIGTNTMVVTGKGSHRVYGYFTPATNQYSSETKIQSITISKV